MSAALQQPRAATRADAPPTERSAAVRPGEPRARSGLATGRGAAGHFGVLSGAWVVAGLAVLRAGHVRASLALAVRALAERFGSARRAAAVPFPWLLAFACLAWSSSSLASGGAAGEGASSPGAMPASEALPEIAAPAFPEASAGSAEEARGEVDPVAYCDPRFAESSLLSPPPPPVERRCVVVEEQPGAVEADADSDGAVAPMCDPSGASVEAVPQVPLAAGGELDELPCDSWRLWRHLGDSQDEPGVVRRGQPERPDPQQLQKRMEAVGISVRIEASAASVRCQRPFAGSALARPGYVRGVYRPPVA